VCRSDWHCWQGDWDWFGYRPDPPHVLGHEPCGTVVSVGERVENVREGDHIAIPFNFACGSCSLCRNGHENICENHVGLGFMNEAPGAFAEEVHIPNADINAVPLPEEIDTDTAAGIGCRFMTSYHGMAHQADVGNGEDVVVHGLGGIGLSAVHIGNALGANVIGVDIMDEKCDRAEERRRRHRRREPGRRPRERGPRHDRRRRGRLGRRARHQGHLPERRELAA
jgi:alcohol dehydrogenase